MINENKPNIAVEGRNMASTNADVSEWIEVVEYCENQYICRECGTVTRWGYDHCPNCYAKMT